MAQVRAFRPDALWMVGDNTVIFPETLAAIQRETGCKLLYACGTSPIVFSKPIDRAAARLYDLIIANDYYHGIQWLELGAKRMECLPLSACDPDFHHPYALTEAERSAFERLRAGYQHPFQPVTVTGPLIRVPGGRLLNLEVREFRLEH